MSIKLENYEALLLDYIEGRLDAQTALALQRFIQQHPELGSWEELTGELPELEAERVLFDQKEALKKPEIIACEGIDESNFGEMFSAWHEGELTESQRQAVAKFLSLNPSLEDDFRLAGMVYLRPDEKIVFAGKSELMRKAVVVKLLTARYISAAASIVLMFTLGWWWMGRTPTDKQSLQAVAAVELPTENDSPATPAYVQAGETFGNPLQSQVEKTNVIRYAEAGFPAGNEERQFREYLPELPKKQAVNIEFARGVQPLRITDDLETRLMIAMLFESEPQMGSVSTGSRFSNLISGLGRAINKVQLPEQIRPDNLLAIGIGVYNTLTDNNVALVKEYESGQLQALMIESDRMAIRRTVP